MALVVERIARLSCPYGLAGSPVCGVVPRQEWGGDAFHRLDLFGGQVFRPSARVAFPVELARALLSVRNVLPGVFLYDPGEFPLFGRDPQPLVDVAHDL